MGHDGDCVGHDGECVGHDMGNAWDMMGDMMKWRNVGSRSATLQSERYHGRVSNGDSELRHGHGAARCD
jgi:hypothetical protein